MNPSTSRDLLVAFFDSLADSWDSRNDPVELGKRLDSALAAWGIGDNEWVLDVGCGTGAMTAALLRRLSPTARVIAVDISPRMIEIARHKNPDPRVEWHCAPVESVVLSERLLDRIVCMGVWPHLENPEGNVRRFHRILRCGGYLHIWHTLGRTQVNAVHAANAVVASHRLAPAHQTATLLKNCGFAVTACIDNEQEYLVTGQKCNPYP